MTIKIISSFSGKCRFLSNFYPVDIKYNGIEYPSVEHAYQASKFYDNNMKLRIAKANTPGDAKRLGRQKRMRDDFDSMKLTVMKSLVRKKFRNTPLGKDLILTSEYYLIEGNNWGDRFWGVCNGYGENHLGKILMKIREGM